MKKILSKSKMVEHMHLEPKKGSGARFAVFEKDKETDLEDSDFDFLKSNKNGAFNFLLDEGTFVLIDSGQAVVTPPQISKKQQKKLDKAQEEMDKKSALEVANARQGQ